MAKARALTLSTAHTYYQVFARECSAAAFEAAIQLVLQFGIIGALDHCAEMRETRGELPMVILTRTAVEYLAQRMAVDSQVHDVLAMRRLLEELLGGNLSVGCQIARR